MAKSYAVIETGGKQQKVIPGDILDVELLASSEVEMLENNGNVVFSNVLLIADGEKLAIGTPYVNGATVSAKVIGNIKDDKVTAFKYKNKINYHRTLGHRQNYTRVQIEEIKHGA